jgi:hypothetical protein
MVKDPKARNRQEKILFFKSPVNSLSNFVSLVRAVDTNSPTVVNSEAGIYSLLEG